MFLLKSQEVSLLNYFYQDFISLWVLRITSFWKVGPGRGEWESTVRMWQGEELFGGVGHVWQIQFYSQANSEGLAVTPSI